MSSVTDSLDGVSAHSIKQLLGTILAGSVVCIGVAATLQGQSVNGSQQIPLGGNIVLYGLSFVLLLGVLLIGREAFSQNKSFLAERETHRANSQTAYTASDEATDHLRWMVSRRLMLNGVSEEDAYGQIESGEWTDDRVAKALLSSSVNHSVYYRLRLWAAPEGERQRHIERVLNMVSSGDLDE